MSSQNKLLLGFLVLILVAGIALFACRCNHRETIFDRVICTPKKFVLDIPKPLPLCDEIKDLKKGFIDVPNGGRLYYEEEGSGIPLVLLHGGPGGTHHVFHPYFSQMKNVARIIYYDQRGTGQSSIDPTGKTYTIKQAVEDLENLRKALNIDRWVMLGWSYGGFLAQCYALTCPQHVQGIVLVASSPGSSACTTQSREDMFISAAEKECMQKVRQAFADGHLTKEQAGYNKDLCGDWKRQGYYKPTCEELARQTWYEWSPAPGFNNLMSLAGSEIDLAGKFVAFDIPTLIYEATWDLTWDAAKTTFMRKNHPHAQVEVFEKSGHCIFGDEPERFFSLLKIFLDIAAKTPISKLPVHTLVWPDPPSDMQCAVIIAGDVDTKVVREKALMALYDQFVKNDTIDVQGWFYLAYKLASIKNPALVNQIVDALDRAEKSAQKMPLKNWDNEIIQIKIFRGHAFDLMSKRAQAIAQYKEALRIYDSMPKPVKNVMRDYIEQYLQESFKG